MACKRNPRVFEYQHTVYSEQSKMRETDLSLCTNTAFPTGTQIQFKSPFTPHISLSYSKKSDRESKSVHDRLNRSANEGGQGKGNWINFYLCFSFK